MNGKNSQAACKFFNRKVMNSTHTTVLKTTHTRVTKCSANVLKNFQELPTEYFHLIDALLDAQTEL